MISYQDIANAIMRLLRKETDVPTITDERIDEPDYPLFHVSVIPMSSSTVAAGYQSERIVYVDISYMEGEMTPDPAIRSVMEQLQAILSPVLQVKDSFFTIDASMNITDHVGHYTFMLTYYVENVRFIEQAEAGLMHAADEGIDLELTVRRT